MIGIVTDSMSCMTERDAAAYNVRIARAKCVIGTRTVPDTVEPYPKSLERARTLPPSSADYYRIFASLAAECDEIICITSSDRVTMSYTNACLAAKAAEGPRFAIIDSGATAGALYLLVRMCRELEASGAGFGDIVSIISKQKTKLNMSFSLRDLQAVMRTGRRISASAGVHAPIMDQRPVCTFEGGGRLVVKETASGALNELRALAAEHHSPRRIVVHYCEADMHLYELVSLLRRRFPDADIIRRRVAMSIRIVTGEDALGVFSYGMGE